MNIHFKVFASYNILQYMCDCIHVLIFVTVSKCRKSPKLTSIVITDNLSVSNRDTHDTASYIHGDLASDLWHQSPIVTPTTACILNLVIDS
jgi:hypothetical protein